MVTFWPIRIRPHISYSHIQKGPYSARPPYHKRIQIQLALKLIPNGAMRLEFTVPTNMLHAFKRTVVFISTLVGFHLSYFGH